MEAVALDGVTLIREGRTILRDVTWKVAVGEHWALLGLNGSGKTSLLRLLAGYFWPTQGEVRILGETLGRVELRKLRPRLGLVSTYLREWFEQHHPEEAAVDVVASGFDASIGGPKERREEAQEILASLGGRELTLSPFGHLSQGQKQLVLIARALAPKPSLLLLDEPCAGLDLRSREIFLETLKLIIIPEGPTVIYAAHHLEEVLPSITHACLMRAGGILAGGTKEMVFTPPILGHCYGLPLAVDWQDGRAWVRVVANKGSSLL